jgi:hypothetical protein
MDIPLSPRMKKIREAGLEGCFDGSGVTSENYKEILRMKWISVKDELPEHGQAVLVFQTFPPGTLFQAIALPLNRCKCKVLEYQDRGGRIAFISRNGELHEFVSHWMPLPTPPKQ